MGGRKQVFRSGGYRDIVALEGKSAPRGHEALLKPLLKDGKITSRFKGIEELRSQTIKELMAVTKAEPSLGWV